MTPPKPKRKPFVAHVPSVSSTRKETALKAQEQAPVIVKVVLVEGSKKEAMIYRLGRLGLKHQELPMSVRLMLGKDQKGHFMASWSHSLLEWTIIKRSPNEVW
jgi:hypothetical protein